ncbi:MAG: M28 family peptidase [Flavobacteriaceae bacterium]|nr:M28 family peptidase [Bacteroidia bacterium]NNK87310.1 M28 family peptidase [Flavobacteriaceae bacterium]
MIKKAVATILILVAVIWSFSSLRPSQPSGETIDTHSFSTARALVHVEQISKSPHSIGTPAHETVRSYIVKELEDLGLEVQVQEGFSLTSWRNLAKAKNILARIKGTRPGKALLLLSHYDSSPHSSYGASDAASGVATILEGLRAFLNSEEQPENDIIVLISDGEELGLNGADLFVNSHEWAKDVGLVLNFEARGSGGPSYMLIETNGGNSKLIENFKKAAPSYPVGNSLAYSIYKMLPNDTDLTIFRQEGDIDGFNFAFIGDHFDYHTALDNYERLDRESLEHQGQYLMPLLAHFSQANLDNLKSSDDLVYYNAAGIGMASYPFSWIWPLLIIGIILFALLITYGFRIRRLNVKDVLTGFVPFLGSLVLCALVSQGIYFLLSKLLYPGYSEILHGFTYNGYTYIASMSLFSLAICFWLYAVYYKPGNTASFYVAPITIWIIINILMALKLQGGSFFIIPVFFALLSFTFLIWQRKPSLILMALLGFPVLLIMSPFVKMFPVGLGLKILFVSGILVSLIFGLLIPVFGFFKHKRRWSILIGLVAFGFLIASHLKSGFNSERPKPNSLVYTLDADNNSAKWSTYDNKLDSWTMAVLGDDPKEISAEPGTVFASKYRTGFTFERQAEIKALVYPDTEIYKDTVIGDLRHVSLYIGSKRPVSRIDLYASPEFMFKTMTVNGIEIEKEREEAWVFQNRTADRLLSYFVSDNHPLDIQMSFPKDQVTSFTLFESSNDLLTNRLFNVKARTDDMIPKPFVLNDAVTIKKSILIE